MKKKSKRVSRSIVVGHLEKVSSGIFDKNRGLITEMIRGHYGLYALYRREKLYYVGLATDLRKRINHHLRDRHKGKWTRFSLYILRKTEHLREIETLLLRIADPTGNSVKGRLSRSKNLLPDLKRQVKKQQNEERERKQVAFGGIAEERAGDLRGIQGKDVQCGCLFEWIYQVRREKVLDAIRGGKSNNRCWGSEWLEFLEV